MNKMKKTDFLRLDNQLCFLLYANSRGLTRLYRPLLEKLGITYPQYLVFLVLWEKDGQGVMELGRHLVLDSGTLTPLLKRMEKAGLVNRKRSAADERKVTIHLTEKGRQLKQQAFDIPETLFCRSGLTVDRYLSLKKELENLLRQIQTHENHSTE